MSTIIVTNVMIVTAAGNSEVAPYYERGYIRIEDDRLVEVSAGNPADNHAVTDVVIDGQGKLAMPGLVNGHNHFEQTFMSGIVRLFSGSTAEWIRDFKIPMTLNMEADDYYYSAMLAATQMIRSGVTCSVNHVCQQSARRLRDFGIDQVFRAVGDAGIRCLTPIGLAGKNEPDEFIVEAAEYDGLLREWHAQGNGAFSDRLRVWAGPTGFYSSTPSMWTVARRFVEDVGGGIHTHLATFERGDVDQAQEVGVLDDNFVGAHCVWLDAQDVARLSAAGAAIVHNPTYKLGFSIDSDVHGFGDGIAPVTDLHRDGCTIGLGQDGCMGDTQDMFKEMRMLAYTQHYRYRDKDLFPPTKLLEMATIDCARTMKWDGDIGSLEPGKKADLILVDLSDPKFVPLLNVPANLVYQANAENVDTVIINGEIVMRDREILSFDENDVLQNSQRVAKDLVKRSGLHALITRGFVPWASGHLGEQSRSGREYQN